MLVAGIVILAASVIVYVLGTAYLAGEYRKQGFDPRTSTTIPEESIPDIPRPILRLVMLSYPGALIGVVLIVVGIV